MFLVVLLDSAVADLLTMLPSSADQRGGDEAGANVALAEILFAHTDSGLEGCSRNVMAVRLTHHKVQASVRRVDIHYRNLPFPLIIGSLHEPIKSANRLNTDKTSSILRAMTEQQPRWIWQQLRWPVFTWQDQRLVRFLREIYPLQG